MGLMVLFVIGGCSIEYRTHRQQRQNSPEYNERHHRPHHRDAKVRISVDDRH